MTYPLKTLDERSEAVRWAYRLFLDREPENEAVVAALHKADSASLRQAFVASEEYAGTVQRNLSLPPKIVPVNAPTNHVDVEISTDVANKLLAHVQRTWTRLGQEVPHWSVLSSDEYRPDNIAQTADAFYASGDYDLGLLVGMLARHGFKPRDFRTCFEFGSGLGRVTIPLSRTFDRVIACDISSSHLGVARQRGDEQKRNNITYVLAVSGDFGISEGFDLWFSRIVLQHNPPPIMHAILDRAFGKLNRGGVAVFQIPTHATGYRFDARAYAQKIAGSGEIEMHCLPQRYIFDLAHRHGLQLLEVREEFSAGPHDQWISNVFVIQRPK